MTVTAEDFMNNTEFENDPFATVDENVINEAPPSSLVNVFGYYFIVTTIIKLILILAVIAGNIFLAIVIIRFKRLRAVRSNVFILHLCILNIVYYLCSPLFLTLGHIMSSYETVTTFTLQTQMTLLTLYMTFAVCLAVDWFLTAKKSQYMKLSEKYYRFIYVAMYLLFLIEWAISLAYSEIQHVARAGLFFIFYVIYLIVLIVLNILKKKLNLRSQAKKTEYSLSVSNIIIFSFLPIFLFHINLHIVVDNVAIVMLFLEIFPALIEIGHPLWIIYLLGRQNKYFKMAYYKSFKRSVRGYVDEDLDAISEEEDFRNILTPSTFQVSVNGLQEEV